MKKIIIIAELIIIGALSNAVYAMDNETFAKRLKAYNEAQQQWGETYGGVEYELKEAEARLYYYRIEYMNAKDKLNSTDKTREPQLFFLVTQIYNTAIERLNFASKNYHVLLKKSVRRYSI